MFFFLAQLAIYEYAFTLNKTNEGKVLNTLLCTFESKFMFLICVTFWNLTNYAVVIKKIMFLYI